MEGGSHTQLFLQTGFRRSSRGRALSRFHELEEEVLTFLTTQHSELADFPSDKLWFSKVAFLADLFQSLNTFNKSVEGDCENILTCTYKINTFEEKHALGRNIQKRKCSRNVGANKKVQTGWKFNFTNFNITWETY